MNYRKYHAMEIKSMLRELEVPEPLIEKETELFKFISVMSEIGNFSILRMAENQIMPVRIICGGFDFVFYEDRTSVQILVVNPTRFCLENIIRALGLKDWHEPDKSNFIDRENALKICEGKKEQKDEI